MGHKLLLLITEIVFFIWSKSMNNLRKKRRLLDITQNQLSLKTQIPQSTISLVERGFKIPDLKMKHKISKALKCKVQEIFSEK